MGRDEIIAAITQKTQALEGARALFLSGSLGADGGDDYSDADLILVMAGDAHAPFLEQVRGWIEEITPLIHWFQPVPGIPIFSAITDAWERIDLSVTISELILGTKESLSSLYDPEHLLDGVADTAPERQAEQAKLLHLTHEFIRVLGLTPVAMGRKDYVVAMQGAGLMRSHTIEFEVECLALPTPPGMLNLSANLPKEARMALEGLPAVAAEPASLWAHQTALAAHFIPRAQLVLGDAFPTPFWNTTKAHLEKAGFSF